MAIDTTSGQSAPDQSESHELANAFTHGIGFVLSILATVAVVTAGRMGGFWIAAAAASYGTTLALVYAFSTLSHAVKDERWKAMFRAWDQGTIYFLIVGTYTPFVAVYLPPTFAAIIAAVIWIAAMIGFYSKVIAKHRVNALATRSYLLLGWLPALAFIGRVPLAVAGGMAVGGVSYTIGVIFLKLDQRFAYFHAVWHVFVMIASAIHFFVIYLVVLPS